jgi:hypothetical protein
MPYDGNMTLGEYLIRRSRIVGIPGVLGTAKTLPRGGSFEEEFEMNITRHTRKWQPIAVVTLNFERESVVQVEVGIEQESASAA